MVLARVPFSLHLPLAEDASGLSARQSRLGVPEVWSVRPYTRTLTHTQKHARNLASKGYSGRMALEDGKARG